MAGKKVKSEVDAIRGELRSLSEAVWALREKFSFEAAAHAATGEVAATSGSADDAGPVADDTESGTVAIAGVMCDASGTQEYRWEHSFAIDDLLAIDDESSIRVLAAIGHRQRLAIVTTMLRQPMSAAELVASLDLGTTGAAYHHLNVLVAAGLVVQESRGVFAIMPDRVGTIVTILAGLSSTASVTAAANAVAEGEPKSSGKSKASKKHGV